MKCLFCLLLSLFTTALLAQPDKWALVVGISQYPQLSAEFPPIPSGEKDALYLSHQLRSRHGQFRNDRVILLTGQQATTLALRQAFSQQLNRSQPQDLVVIFFAGHALRHQVDGQFYLLWADSDPDNPATWLSLYQLKHLLEIYVPARQIMVCLDARHTDKSLGSLNFQEAVWSDFPDHKQVVLLEASAPYEKSKERSGHGLFAYFLGKALELVPFLEKNADLNGDGLVTVSEMGQFVAWAMQFSGISQHPSLWGNCSAVLTSSFGDSAKIQLVKPTLLRMVNQPVVPTDITGFIRAAESVTEVKIEQSSLPAQWGKLSEQHLAKYGLPLWPHTYWFSATVALQPGQEQFEAQIGLGQRRISQAIALSWSYPGWYGEWMPPGLGKGMQEGVYLWQRDGSQMVYVPPGSCKTGLPPGEKQKLAEELTILRGYLAEHREWLQQDLLVRKEISLGLEQSNETVRQLAQRLQSIYKRIETFSRVQSSIYSSNPAADDKQRLESAQKSLDNSTRPMDSHAMPVDSSVPETKDTPTVTSDTTSGVDQLVQAPPSPLQESLFLTLSYELLHRCYQAFCAAAQEKQEVEEVLHYLDLLLANGHLDQLPTVQTSTLAGFYLDRFEMSNRRYKAFCDTTARPYPAAPWWDDGYFFDSPDAPVIQVSWEDSLAYCFWAGKTLPTALEMEKSMRGLDGNRFPWGNFEASRQYVHANIPPSLGAENLLQLPAMVPLRVDDIRFPPSVYGAYHLAGNVQEWCADLPPYLGWLPSQPAGQYRVAKGGSWASPATMLTGWFVQPLLTHRRRCDLGFRGMVKGCPD